MPGHSCIQGDSDGRHKHTKTIIQSAALQPAPPTAPSSSATSDPARQNLSGPLDAAARDDGLAMLCAFCAAAAKAALSDEYLSVPT